MMNRRTTIQLLQRLNARLTGAAPRRGRQRGSALLVSLMIMVGLTLLGLGFVAITQTESAISMNEKNYTQTLQIAEAAANRIVDWFQNPNWAVAENICPNNVDAIKVTRTIAQPQTYTGKYKANVGELLFDRPFKPNPNDRFYGTETNPDIWINTTTAPAFLKLFNIMLFNNDQTLTTMDNNEGGVITDIRIFAPPVQGALINTQAGWTAAASGAASNASGFVEGGTRFGIATVEATATKYSVPCTDFPCSGTVIATRTVKISIAEWPFPGPQGPVQTNADLDTSGNIRIHWGMTTATGDMTMAKTAVSIPWMDAYDIAHFEHGFDTKVWPTGFNDNQWPKVASASESEVHNWLYELLGKQFQDPWWQMRARGSLNLKGFTPAANPIPYPYTYGVQDPTTNKSNWFEGQYQNEYPIRKDTLFPRIDYNFWKQLAQAGDDQPNIYFLQNVLDSKGGTTDSFKDKAGNTRTFEQWVDTTAAPPAGTGPKSVAGFYFFDTANGINPQNGGGGTLTAPVTLQGGTLQMKGFIYSNVQTFGTQGLGGVAEWINMPGEPYRDIGYLDVVDTGDYTTATYAKADPAGPVCDPNANQFSNCSLVLANNGIWDFEDMNISNSNAGKNGVFDFVVAQRPGMARSAGAGGGTVPAADSWTIVPYTPGCNPGVNCSEPAEPYLNLIYPTAVTGSPMVDWYDPSALTATLGGIAGTQTRRPKQLNAAGNPVTCVAESSSFATPALLKADRAACTSNGYDRDGGLVSLSNILDGVLYIEGDFDTTGNANYFGSVLVQGDATKAGNPEIYFDERLVKGQWPPASFGFPRVYVSGVETDQ